MRAEPSGKPDPHDDEPWKGKDPRPPVGAVRRLLQVSMGGPHKRWTPPLGSAGWNAGDIDLRPDGAIFIRNPYLADAIEAHLQKNFGDLPGGEDGNEKFLIRIVRDEGWSGTETNIVC